MTQQTQDAPAAIRRDKRRRPTISKSRPSTGPARSRAKAEKTKAPQPAQTPATTAEQLEAERRAAEERRIQQTWVRYKKEPTWMRPTAAVLRLSL